MIEVIVDGQNDRIQRITIEQEPNESIQLVKGWGLSDDAFNDIYSETMIALMSYQFRD